MYSSEQTTHYFLSDGVVGSLQVTQHFCHDLLGVAAVTHGVEEVDSPLANADVALRLDEKNGEGVLQLASGETHLKAGGRWRRTHL